MNKSTNKLKGLFGIGMSILFVMLGFHLYFTKSMEVDDDYTTLIKIVGGCCTFFFGLAALLGLKKLLLG